MGDKRMVVRPLAVAFLGREGSIALFECEAPAAYRGKVSVWATCGQRRRFPVPAKVTLDCREGEGRRIVAQVEVPPDYTACTLHVRIRDGRRIHCASCRIPHERFRKLAPTASNAENDERYHRWFVEHRLGAKERQRQEGFSFSVSPLISIVVPVYRTPEEFLVDLIESVLAQTYRRWELVIVNVSGPCEEVEDVLGRYGDERIRVVTAPNKSIPENTNVGIEAARGDYVAFVDHDDFIEPDILFHYVEAINEHPDGDLFFCDEDLWDARFGCFCGARFKPGWNSGLILSHNYVCHMLMVSRRALDLTERSGVEVNGAQDYDLTLKAAEVAREICHVPGVYYHWRKHPQSTASSSESKPYAVEAGRIAVQSHCDRVGLAARVESDSDAFTYRSRYQVDAAGVSIVLLELDGGCASCEVESVDSGGRTYEFLAASTMAGLNDAVNRARYSHVIVLDSSVEAIGEAVVDMLLGQLVRDEVGCSSALLADDAGIVKSAGLVYRSDGTWQNAFEGVPRQDFGYMLMLGHPHDVLSVPLRCMAFRKEDFQCVGGFDEGLDGDWPAVDFCLKLREHGKMTALVPYEPVVLKGGQPVFPDGAVAELLRRRHALLAKGDPYLSEHLDQCMRLV